jgi:hypothetical protein
LADYHDSIYKGEATKGLVKVLLQKAGYAVYPYGYESTLADIREKLQAKDTKNSPTVRRIRSSPDLLVYDDEKRDLVLVEVKMRTSETPFLEQRRMDMYKEFWNDSILVFVVPMDNVFYAQRICDLECKEKYNPNSDFLKIEEIFTRIKSEDVKHYGREALKLMQRTENSNAPQ